MSSNNESNTIKSAIWYTASNFLLRGIGFITTPIFARLLTQEEYGEVSNYTSWVNIMTIIICLNLPSTLISAKYDYKDDFDGYIFSILTLSTLSTLIWALILNVFSDLASSILHLSPFYINCMLVYLLLYSALSLFQTRERYLYKYKTNVAISVTIAVGGSLLSVFLVLILPDRQFGKIIGGVIPTILLGMIAYTYFVIKGKRIIFRTWKYALIICLPFIPHSLSLTLLNSVDRVMIRDICGASDTALYNLVYSCGALITLLLSSLNGAIAPWIGDRLHNKEYARIHNMSGKYILGFAYLAVAIMLITPEAVLILGGESYYSAIYVMPPVAMGCICQFIYTLFVNVEQFNKKTVGMAIGSVSAALINYGLNSVLIPLYGYIAAAYTTLIGYLWLLIVHMFLVWRIKLNQVYDYKFIIIIVSVLCGITALVNLLYGYNILRYIVIGLYLCIGVIIAHKYQDDIKYLFGKMKRS